MNWFVNLLKVPWLYVPPPTQKKGPPYIEWARDKAMNYIFIYSCDKNHMMRKVLLDDKKERRKKV
jgi:hypothetical protein